MAGVDMELAAPKILTQKDTKNHCPRTKHNSKRNQEREEKKSGENREKKIASKHHLVPLAFADLDLKVLPGVGLILSLLRGVL